MKPKPLKMPRSSGSRKLRGSPHKNFYWVWPGEANRAFTVNAQASTRTPDQGFRLCRTEEGQCTPES